MSKISFAQLLAVGAFIAFALSMEKIGIGLIIASVLCSFYEQIQNKKNDGVPVERLKKNLMKSNFHVPYTGTVRQVMDVFGFSVNTVLTKSQSAYLSKVVNKLGYRIEPDARLTDKKYALDEYVCIYTDMNKLPITMNYRIAGLFAEVGYKILMADDNVTQSETWFLERTLATEFNLNESERARLQKKLELMSHGLSTQSGIIMRRLLQQSDAKSRSSIAQFVISVAACDGVIHVKEMELLKKFFGQLGLTTTDLTRALADLKGQEKQLTIQQRLSRYDRRRVIASQIETNEEAPLELNLDPDKLSRVMLNTSDIHQTLEAIFTDDHIAAYDQRSPDFPIIDDEKNGHEEKIFADETEEDDSDEVAEDEVIEAETDIEKPDYVDEIIQRDEWTQADLRSLIAPSGLMLSTVIDEINEWSEDVYGDFLIAEEDNIYYVNEDVVDLIREDEENDE